MSGKLTAILAGTILAMTGAILPASANVVHESFDNALLNKIGQPLTDVSGSGQQKTILLAVNGNEIKGGHQTGKSPSNKQKHQQGDARRQQDQQKNPAFQDAKKKASTRKLSKGTIEKLNKQKEADKKKNASRQNAESSKKANARTR